jgi:ABC-type methionine transport system permease subunit
VEKTLAKMRLWEKLKEKLKGNIFFQALPFAILIAAFTFFGLWGGFLLGDRIGSSTASFALAVVLSLLGFFFGLFLSYTLVKLKYE